VVGATGNIGSGLCRNLLSAGHPVRALSRGGAELDELVKRGAEPFIGTFDEGTLHLDAFFKDVDAAFTMVRSDWSRIDHYPKTAARLSDALRASPVPLVVNLSSFGAELAENAGHSSDFHALESALNGLPATRIVHFGVEIACDDNGLLLSIRARHYVDIGTYPLFLTTSGIDAGGAAHHMMGPYRVKHCAFDSSSVVTHKAPTASYRGVAVPINVLAMETLLERMAKKIGIDPIEIRRRNLIRPEDLPYMSAVGVPHDTASHIECLDRALAMVGYDHFDSS
jgi:hypothetical protein